jgi:hypothetical protein
MTCDHGGKRAASTSFQLDAIDDATATRLGPHYVG